MAGTIQKIQNLVCEYYGVKMQELLSRRRPARIAFPRMVGMYLSRETTSFPLEVIGGVFDRHHTAIIYGHATVEDYMDIYPEIDMSVNYLRGCVPNVQPVPVVDYIPPAFLPYENCN